MASEMVTNMLTPEQWRHVEDLSQSLDVSQAQWLSGFFAGFGAGLRPTSSPQPAPFTGGPLILYGTETGNAPEIARALESAARDAGLAPTLADMADYKVRQLGQERTVLIIVSTHGEGDPPEPATSFFEFVEGRKAPKLETVRFAVLALGDSTYEFFCGAGKRLDSRLEELGATRLAPRVDCDVDFEEPASLWTRTVIELLAGEAAAAPAAGIPAARSLPGVAAPSAHDKRNPFPARVVENIVIVGRGSSKETHHIELSLAGSGLVYEPGDSLGIAATNDPQVVAALLDALALPSETEFEFKGWKGALGEALQNRCEITVATPRFLDYWALLSDSAELKRLQQEDHSGERAVFLHTHHIVDIVRRFPVGQIGLQDFASALRPLQPRLYSLASSLASAPEEAHLTVSPVRYTLHDEPRAGVASSLLADRAEPDALLPVYVQPNSHFRLPADDVPVVMIGAGTGVAPYRAFMQEREARGARGRNWLFFGERKFRTDFLYQTEWQSWMKDGMLSRMDVAFSRDRAEKVYVQHRMKERASDLFAWLEEGAHIYVCGDAARLAPDVHEALIEIVAAEAHTGREAAEDYVHSLQADHRYQRDVY